MLTLKKLSVLFLITCTFSINILLANETTDGWEAIQKNDFIAAKQSFVAALKNNPKDVEALRGLLFISETAQDGHEYDKRVKQLVEANWDEATYRLFDHVYEGEIEDILNQNFSQIAKVKAMMYVADSLFENRKKKKALKVWRSTVADYNWSVIGPFKNVAGSGHINAHSVEMDDYSPDKTYTNESKLDLKWLNYQLRSPKGLVQMDDILPKSREAVYYANTFVKVPTDRALQLRITRQDPVKIWVDGDLVFDHNDPSTFEWDEEIIQLKVKSGTHRILIKLSPYKDIFSNRRGGFSLYYNDGNAPFLSPGYEDYGGQRNDLIFALRLTDEQGKHFEDITSDYKGNISKQKYTPQVSSKHTIKHFKQLVKDNPENWSNYYLLTKAFIKHQAYLEGEEFFVNLLKEKKAFKKSVYFNFLLAKFFSNTDKSDRSEAILSDLDKSKTPLFELLYQEFQKLDADKDETKYLAGLKELHALSPSNWSIINKFITFYDNKGQRDEKRAFIQSVIDRYPNYSKSLGKYLEDDSYKPSSYKPMTDKEREQDAKKARKRIKSQFLTYDYQTLIRFYKNTEKIDKVLGLYDDLIEMLPYRTDYLENKANYLFEKDQLDAALKTLNKITPYEPFNTGVLETIGDIYVEKKNEKTALSFYEKVEKISRATSSSRFYNGVDLEKKINRIKGEEKNEVKDLFKEVTFDEVLKDNRWVQKYSGEESVILLYTVDMELKDNDNFDVETKMMIKILNEAGAKFWTETNFNFVGQVNSAKVIKPDGREITPEMNYSYAVIKNLAPGDVIQVEGSFEYNMSTEVNNESFMLSGLSYEAPIYYQKLEIITEAGKELNIACNRMDCESFKIRTEKKEKSYTIRTLERQFVPKMEQEAAVLDRLDAVSWIMVGTMQDWTKISQWYLDKTYRKLELTYEIKNAIDTIVNDGMTDEEKVIALYNFVTKDIKYSYVSFLQSNFIPKSPASTLSAGIGDCKDVSSLSIAMLRYVGIEAYYVLVKTRDFTNLEPIPSILFDHVITGYVLDGKMRYMDLTTDYYPYYVVHEGDSDAWALLVKKGNNQAFRLPDDFLNKEKNTLKIDATVQLNLDKSINLKVNSNADGLIGGRIREEVNGLPINEQKKYISTFFGKNAFKNLEVEAFDFGNLTKITPPLASNFTLKSNSYLDKVSSLFIFQLPLLQSVGASGLLTPATRYNDLDLAQTFEITPSIQDIMIEVPKDYHISEIPENVQMDNPFFKYQLTFEKAGDGMKMHREMVFKERIVVAKDYQAFKKEYLKLLDVDLMKHYIIGKNK
jgi:hypothetical protein